MEVYEYKPPPEKQELLASCYMCKRRQEVKWSLLMVIPTGERKFICNDCHSGKTYMCGGCKMSRAIRLRGGMMFLMHDPYAKVAKFVQLAQIYSRITLPPVETEGSLIPENTLCDECCALKLSKMYNMGHTHEA